MLGVLVYTFARISAVLQVDVDDYYQEGKRWWVRLHEKGGTEYAVPLHHKAEEYVDAYIGATNLAGRSDMPLFRYLFIASGVAQGEVVAGCRTSTTSG